MLTPVPEVLGCSLARSPIASQKRTPDENSTPLPLFSYAQRTNKASLHSRLVVAAVQYDFQKEVKYVTAPPRVIADTEAQETRIVVVDFAIPRRNPAPPLASPPSRS